MDHTGQPNGEEVVDCFDSTAHWGNRHPNFSSEAVFLLKCSCILLFVGFFQDGVVQGTDCNSIVAWYHGALSYYVVFND